jgi:hypothetical protein
MNKSRNKLNQPPTGEGKKQSPRSGDANKLHKRDDVLQAGHAEQISAPRKCSMSTMPQTFPATAAISTASRSVGPTGRFTQIFGSAGPRAFQLGARLSF